MRVMAMWVNNASLIRMSRVTTCFTSIFVNQASSFSMAISAWPRR